MNEKQNSELAALIHCLESSEEGQEGLNKVFNEAENHKPGTGAVLREMWHMEKEDFFKDQSKNGRLDHNFYDLFNLYTSSVFCIVPGILMGSCCKLVQNLLKTQLTKQTQRSKVLHKRHVRHVNSRHRSSAGWPIKGQGTPSRRGVPSGSTILQHLPSNRIQ